MSKVPFIHPFCLPQSLNLTPIHVFLYSFISKILCLGVQKYTKSLHDVLLNHYPLSVTHLILQE